mgnify:CR=1 FL=1
MPSAYRWWKVSRMTRNLVRGNKYLHNFVGVEGKMNRSEEAKQMYTCKVARLGLTDVVPVHNFAEFLHE